MEVFRSVFPEDPDEDEVNRALIIVFLTMAVVAGSVYMLSPAQRIRSWWNRVAAPAPTPTRAPASSGPTVADNRVINQRLPGTFVEDDGNDQDSSPDDFAKPFWEYTEQDVANMKAAWRKCLHGRAADAAACTERISQLQAEARNARQTERTRVAVEAMRADAAEIRADAAEAQAETAERNLRDHKRRFVSSALFRHHPDDQKRIMQLLEDKEALQSQLDACVDSKRRSVLPKEIEEYQKQLEKARRDASNAKKSLLEEQKYHRNILLRQDKAEKIIREHGTSADTRRRLRHARATVAEQKNTIEQQRVDLAEHSARAAELQGRIDEGVEANKRYETAHSEQKRTIKRQQEELEGCEAKVQECQASESEFIATKRQLQERFDALLEEFQGKETLLEDSERTLSEARQRLSKSADLQGKLRSDNEELKYESKTKDVAIGRLRSRIADVKKGERGDSACENCKTLEGRITRLQDWQKSQQASSRQDRKHYADTVNELKEAKSALRSNMTDKAKFWINKAKDQTEAVKAERDALKSTLNTRNDELKKLTEELNALKLAKGTDPDCEERCRKLQAEIDNLNAATPSIDCEKCKELKAEIERLNEYMTSAPPAKLVQKLMSRDTTIKALQQEVVAAKANAGGADADEVTQLKNDRINFPAEIEQLKIWLEEVRVALCSMLLISSGDTRLPTNSESEPNELSGLLQEIKEKCSRAEAWRNEVNDLQKKLKESNLCDYRQEIETLKEFLATSQAELIEARAPTGPLKPDNKIRQIIALKRHVADLESLLKQVQAPTSAGEDVSDKITDQSWKVKLDACEARHVELTAKIECLEGELAQTRGDHNVAQADLQTKIEEFQGVRKNNAARIAGLKDELEQARSSAPVSDTDAQKVIDELRQQLEAAKTAKNEAQQKLESCEAQHAELVAAMEDLKTELKKTKQERDNCQDKDFSSNKQKVDQLEGELSTVRKALAAAQADLETAEEELETLRNADGSEVEEGVDAAAHEKIRSLTAELDSSKVALGNSRTEAEEQKTKNGELSARVDQLRKKNELLGSVGSRDVTAIASLQQDRDAAQSEAARIRDQAAQEIQQAKNETELVRAEATEKLRQAELHIQNLQNTATDLSNQNGEIQRLRTVNNSLVAEKKDLDTKLAEACAAWNHFGPLATKTETERARLEKVVISERLQAQEASAASFAKENELKQLKTRLENAKSLETAALKNLHGEGKAIIDKLQEQLDTAQQERATAVTANNSLQIRLTDIQRERDAALQALLADNSNNPAVIENTTLRQQVTDLERNLGDTVNRARSQIDELTRSVKAQEQTIQGLNSKYSGYGARSTNSMVSQQKYDEINRENIRLRQENLRLDNWKTSMQGRNAPALTSQLKDEQIRRVRSEDRYNKLFPQIEALRKKLQACEDSHNDTRPTSTTASANLSQVIQMNNALRGEITRNNDRYTRQLLELGRDRDGLLQRLSDIQRQGGDTELADCTQALREATTKNAELQAWKDEYAFMVQQADTMAEANRRIAAAKGDFEKARDDSVDAGFAATRGVVRKKGDGEGDSPPSKTSKAARVENAEDEELFG